MGKRRSTVATIFCSLYSMNFTGNPSFCRMRANFRDPMSASISFRAPVQMTLPVRKISAVHLGECIRMMTPRKRLGEYSEFLVRELIALRSSSQFTEKVATIFLQVMDASMGFCLFHEVPLKSGQPTAIVSHAVHPWAPPGQRAVAAAGLRADWRQHCWSQPHYPCPFQRPRL